MLDSLSETLRADLSRNLQRVSHSNVVLLRQLFAQAEDTDNNLTVDTSYLEDEMLLSLVAKMEEESEKKKHDTLATATAQTASLKAGQLPSLDSRKEADALLSGNAQLKARLIELQQELVNVNREKTELNEKCVALEQKQAETVIATTAPAEPTVSSAEADALREELAAVKSEHTEKETALAELQAAMDMKLQETPQFKAMKDMMAKKNSQIKTMREALAGYGWTEPEDP